MGEVGSIYVNERKKGKRKRKRSNEIWEKGRERTDKNGRERTDENGRK